MGRKKKFLVLSSIIIIVFVIIFTIVGPEYDFFKREISRDFSLTQTVSVERENIFEIIASPEQYLQVLPQTFLEVHIINQTENVIFAEETISYGGIETKILVKHELFPFNKHIIEILDGDVKGSKLVMMFSEIDSKTTISSDFHLKTSGLLAYFPFMNQSNLQSAYGTAIDTFVEYLKRN